MPGIPVQKAIHNLSVNEEKQSYLPALISLAILYFMMGFITCLNDTLVPFFKKGFKLSYADSSLVQFYFFLTYGLISIPAGRIVGIIGYQKGMVFGFLIAAIGALLFLPASVFHLYFLFLAALFTLAIGVVLLQVAANPYVTILGSPETASSRLALIQAVGSMGTTAAPLFGAYFILHRMEKSVVSSETLRLPYLGIAASLLAIAFIIYYLKLPNLKFGNETGSNVLAHKKGIFSFRNLNFGIMGIFAYVGAEVSIGTFLTNYISETLHISEASANTFVAFYWGGMLVFRFLGSFILRFVKPSTILAVGAIVAILFILLSINMSGYMAVWFMVAVGLCNSVMFAIIFSLAVRGLGNYTTKASGLLSTAIVGGAVISFLVGVLKDHASWHVAFLVPVVCYLYLLFYGMNGCRSTQSIKSECKSSAKSGLKVR
jgi:FHS family L-fucose permease-like MFS transporter